VSRSPRPGVAVSDTTSQSRLRARASAALSMTVFPTAYSVGRLNIPGGMVLWTVFKGRPPIGRQAREPFCEYLRGGQDTVSAA
jgi:hypothetical protein